MSLCLLVQCPLGCRNFRQVFLQLVLQFCCSKSSHHTRLKEHFHWLVPKTTATQVATLHEALWKVELNSHSPMVSATCLAYFWALQSMLH